MAGVAVDAAFTSPRAVPNMHGTLHTCRGDVQPVRRPNHRRYRGGMTTIRVGMPSVCGIPHLYAAMIVAESQTPAISRPGERGYYGGATVGIDWATILRIDYLHPALNSCR